MVTLLSLLGTDHQLQWGGGGGYKTGSGWGAREVLPLYNNNKKVGVGGGGSFSYAEGLTQSRTKIGRWNLPSLI